MIFWKHHTFVRFGIHDFYTVKFNLMSIHLTWRNWCKVAMLLKAVAQQLLSEHCGCLHTCILWIFLLFSSWLPYLLYSLPCLFIFINCLPSPLLPQALHFSHSGAAFVQHIVSAIAVAPAQHKAQGCKFPTQTQWCNTTDWHSMQINKFHSVVYLLIYLFICQC